MIEEVKMEDWGGLNLYVLKLITQARDQEPPNGG